MDTQLLNTPQIKVEHEDSFEEMSISEQSQTGSSLITKIDVTETSLDKDVEVELKAELNITRLDTDEEGDVSDTDESMEVHPGADPSVITDELKNIFASESGTSTDLICVLCNNDKKMNTKQLIKHYKRHRKMMAKIIETSKDVEVDLKPELLPDVTRSDTDEDSNIDDTFEHDPSVITEELKNIFELGTDTGMELICVICNNGKKMKPKQLIKHYKTHEKMMIEANEKSNSKITKGEYYCHLCNDDKVMVKNELKEHYEGYHQKTITNKKQFFRQARSKHPRIPRPEVFSCEICMKIVSTKEHLDVHLAEHEDQYVCDTCQEGFKKLIDYILHLQSHSEDKLYKCLLCDFITNKRHLVKSHLYSVHEKFKKYKCDICGKGFSIFTHFEEHKYFHTGEKPFQCNICGQKFMYTRYLNSHKVQIHIHEQKGVVCKICKKVYAHRNSLNTHMRSHKGEVSVCDVCGKTLSSNEKLRLHYRIHTGEKPYKCDYCDKSFKTGTYRAEHERIHTGEKPYICPHCGKGFSQRTSMVIHSRGHTGEKPYVCHICNKGFAARAMVTIHLKSCRGLISNEES